MNVITLLAGIFGILLFAIIWLRMNSLLFRDVASPLNLLLIAWVGPLLLRTLGLSDLESPWRLESIAAILWVTLALFTCVALPVFFLPKRAFAVRADTFRQTMESLRSPSMTALVVGAWIVSFGVYLFAEFLTNPVGIPMLAALGGNDIDQTIHRWGKDTRWAIFSNLLFIITPWMYLTAQSRRRGVARYLLLFLALLYPFFGLLKMSRSDVFVAVLNIGLAEYYRRRMSGQELRIRPHVLFRAVLGVTVAMVLLYFTMALRTGTTGRYADWIEFNAPLRDPWRELGAQIYGYLALPFENFKRFFESYDGGLQIGISVFRPFLSAFGRGDIADAKIATVDFNAVSQAAGSNTFLSFVYAELGLLGILLIPFVYGGLVACLYYWMRNSARLLPLLLYLNFAYPWCWLYFGNAFSVLTFYINAAFIIAILTIHDLLKVSSRRSRRRQILQPAAPR